jgi:hypothetical protein
MAVKPPVSESWPQRDRIDTIDFLPTIARLAGEDVPEYSSGTPIQIESDGNPRITERISPDWYSLAVEVDGIKGIMTYGSNYPDRPTQDVIQEGPKLEEFYDLSTVRNGKYREMGISSRKNPELRRIANEFLLDESVNYDSAMDASRPSQETVEHLQNLGYK